MRSAALYRGRERIFRFMLSNVGHIPIDPAMANSREGSES